MPLAERVPVASVLSGEAGTDVHQWAQDAIGALRGLDQEQLSTMLKPVLDLASRYLTHLLIAGRSKYNEIDLALICIGSSQSGWRKDTPSVRMSHSEYTPDLDRYHATD